MSQTVVGQLGEHPVALATAAASSCARNPSDSAAVIRLQLVALGEQQIIARRADVAVSTPVRKTPAMNHHHFARSEGGHRPSEWVLRDLRRRGLVIRVPVERPRMSS